MVKIAILSHGHIHNTKVILSRRFFLHTCALNINYQNAIVKRFMLFFPLPSVHKVVYPKVHKVVVHKVVNQAIGSNSHAEHGAFGVVVE